MSKTVEMSAPYLGLTHLVSAMAEAVVRANRNAEELQNPEEMEAAAALTCESKLRDLVERRAIKGHDWNSLDPAADWLQLNIDRDVFFVDDLNACEELTSTGFRFLVVEQWQKDNLAILEEFLANGEGGIDWDYWVWKMRTLSTAQAARLVLGLDPDTFPDLKLEPKPGLNNTAGLRKRAFNIERLALSDGRDRHSAFDWLLWVKDQGFEVHHGFSKAANEKKAYEDAAKALGELPPKEAECWEKAEQVADERRQVTFAFAGSLSTRHFTLPQFVEEVADRLARWQDGEYAVIEAAQVLADANSTLDAKSLTEQLEQAMYAGKLVLRRNQLPIPPEDIPHGRLWNRFVRAEDVNDWLTDSRARYRLTYPYDATATAKPEERRVLLDEDWKQLARTRAAEIISERRARDLYPNQNDIADLVAKGFREQGIVGADGKPLTGATIKRHALKGISSEIGKQLSTAPRRGK